MIVGLTGGTGVGKSSVSLYFKENGFEIVDFDLLSRQVCDKGSKCLDEICSHFGTGILNPDGTLDRKALGAVVFSDKNLLGILNTVTHKYILQRSNEIIASDPDADYVFDAPLLFEAELEKMCDCVVSVLSDVKKRAERICKRDGINYEYALKRINSQKNDDFYIEKSDYIIYNNNSADKLKETALEVISEIKKKSHKHFKSAMIFGEGVI